MTPYKAVKLHCKYCMNGNTQEVKLCPDKNCFWYEWRYKKQPGSTLKAIREYCITECVGKEDKNYYQRVENCPVKDCPLYPYRMGKNPYRKELTKEQKEKIAERLKQGRKLAGLVHKP